MKQYNSIYDPMTHTKHSIFSTYGKSILNNYFKTYQKQGGRQRGGGGNGNGNCAVDNLSQQVEATCAIPPDVSGYTHPCSELPLDRAWIQQSQTNSQQQQGSSRRRQRKQSHRRRQSKHTKKH